MTREESIKLLEQENKRLKTVDIKGKDYIPVNERIKAFRNIYPNGCIRTEIIGMENGIVTMKAEALDEEGHLLGTGHAQEKEASTFINKTSYIENCETSAVGRALGNCGIGLDFGFASYEEVGNAKVQQEAQPKEDSKATQFQVDKIYQNGKLIKEELTNLKIKTKKDIQNLSREKASELLTILNERIAKSE